MHADVGDQIVVETAALDRRRRLGVITEVIGVGDEEHYRVRWEDGHESLFYPGGDARILQQRS